MLSEAKRTPSLEQLSIGTACDEYTNSVKLTLSLINHHLDTALSKRFNELEELVVKIAARSSFLEKNPTFLSVLSYDKSEVRRDPVREFDELKITLKEHSKRILDKIADAERHHRQLLDLVVLNGAPDEDDFQDCIDKLEPDCFVGKITMQKDAFSEPDLTRSPVAFQAIPELPAEVQRGRPQQDIHGKLVQQLEASDSLEGFMKLMDRKPQPHRPKTKKPQHGLAQKYTGSLWFFPKSNRRSGASKTSTRSAKQESRLLVTSSQPAPMTHQDRTRHVKQSLGRTRLRYYDLLDDIDGNDVLPIKSEYPRRDVHPMQLHEAKSYLHRMMHENDKVWKKLIQPTEPKKDAEAKRKKARNLMEYLTAPQQKYLTHIPQSLIVMPVEIFYDNFPTKEASESPRGAVLITDLTKTLEAKKAHPFPMQRKKEMLSRLRGLKARNDGIQKNIQKAIDVIESKMIDLLSSPATASTSEAFAAMEEEITNVLKMMDEGAKDKEDRGGGAVDKRIVFNLAPERGEPVQDRTGTSKPEASRKAKKTANIEEGERLLGQVDSVIRKIDSIYTKFHDESKARAPRVVDVLEAPKQPTEPPPVQVSYKSLKGVAVVTCQAREYCQSKIYHPAHLEAEKNDGEVVHMQDTKSGRHDHALKAFYSFFFSSVFVALNLDYAS